MCNYFSKKIPNTERNKKRLEYIRQEAERLLEQPIASLKFSNFKLFHETGERLAYENQSMEHRKRLQLMTAMALSDENEKWISAVEDVMWAMCDEATWAFPAHIAKDADVNSIVTKLDLFSAELGAALGEACYLLKDRLHTTVYDRVQYEIRRRIITPHLKTVLTYRNNWSAVCAYGICSSIVHIGTKEEFEEAKESLVRSAYDFLDSYTEDGCCLEGPNYWSYGFGHFCFLAHMLREQTDGEIDLFKENKVRNIALYLQKTSLEGDYVIPFGDSAHRYRFEYCLVNFLAHEYAEFVSPDPKTLALYEYGDKRERFSRFIRDFYWTEEVLPAKNIVGTNSRKFEVFEQSQQYIRRYKNFIFAAKGGHNTEPHNHNDIGSFIIFKDGQYLLDDLGWPEYDNKYFTSARYENICASSLGHSVPIITGTVQMPRVSKKGNASYTEDRISLDISEVYGVERFTRDFVMQGEAGIIIEDYFEGDCLQITERFVTRIEPEVFEDGVKIGELQIKCDEECDIRISSQEFRPRALGDLNTTETIYFVDFVFEETKREQKTKILIQVS